MIDLDPSAALVMRLEDGGVRAFDAAGTTIIEHSSTDDFGPENGRSA